MKANELRCGNKIIVYKADMKKPIIETINSISAFTGKFNTIEDMHYVRLEECHPIKLNKEWLQKFGFKAHNEGEYWFNMWNYKHFGISKCLIKSLEFLKVGIWYYSDNFIEVKYVHQLQNLYFCLNNEELQVVS